ncbi:symmetrical bis(5'-nucleosyl)-tetraphosphatase [Colwelliaceae bacterium 6441]
MAIYFVGDIQGCYHELSALLKQVNFTPANDQLWVAGDMVARGPDSYKTLKYLISLGDSVKAVLGNHDLHLLAIYAGIKKAKKNDLLDELLASPDADKLMNWLTKQPLLRKLPNENVYMSHAGLSPQWTISEAIKAANFAQGKLSSSKRTKWLAKMYGETPCDWHSAKTKTEKFRYTINALTRMRYCLPDGQLEFSCKEPPSNVSSNFKPWFDLAKKQLHQSHWIFGHWASLMGKVPAKNLYALDTGCVWGGHLTLLRWHDRTLFIEKSHKT